VRSDEERQAFDVLRRSCTEPHDGEAFAVLALPGDVYPGVVEVYDAALAGCTAEAQTNHPEAAASAGVRIQVMTPTPDSWRTGAHQAVCYFDDAEDRTASHLG
jgi:hypothetical protein